ncbi:hypothetical protein ACSFVZ_16485 [Pseudoalteromonas sp. SYSU M81236]
MIAGLKIKKSLATLFYNIDDRNLFTDTISEKPIKTVGLYFLGGSVVAHFRIRKYRASKLKESKPDHQV